MKQKPLQNDLTRLRKNFKTICKEMSYEGKLFGVETTEDLEGNNIWNRLHVETKNQLVHKLSLNEGDYLWLAIGNDDEKTVKTRCFLTSLFLSETSNVPYLDSVLNIFLMHVKNGLVVKS